MYIFYIHENPLLYLLFVSKENMYMYLLFFKKKFNLNMNIKITFD